MKMVAHISKLLLLLVIFSYVSSAPVQDKPSTDKTRQQKSLAFYEYYHPEEIDYNTYDPDTDDYIAVDIEENELSRAIPSRKRFNSRPPALNSPIYYIRLPPQPYMFVPGVGYVSEPPSHPMNQFLNVPVSFLANGKPSTIYQWNGGLGQFPGALPPPPPPTPKPQPQPPKPSESSMHRLPGQYVFNGKPEDIYVLRDSYNSLYSDALQNFYP